jgi:hypothetical protein
VNGGDAVNQTGDELLLFSTMVSHRILLWDRKASRNKQKGGRQGVGGGVWEEQEGLGFEMI